MLSKDKKKRATGMKVIFYSYNFATDKDCAVGSIVWDGKKMRAFGPIPSKVLDDLRRSGVKDVLNGGRQTFPKDGVKFLELLRIKYDAAWLRASEVMEV
jgi:hypothetical protein